MGCGGLAVVLLVALLAARACGSVSNPGGPGGRAAESPARGLPPAETRRVDTDEAIEIEVEVVLEPDAPELEWTLVVDAGEGPTSIAGRSARTVTHAVASTEDGFSLELEADGCIGDRLRLRPGLAPVNPIRLTLVAVAALRVQATSAGAPVEGARATLAVLPEKRPTGGVFGETERQAVTAANGVLLIRGLDPRVAYSLEVRHPDHRKEVVERVEVTPGETAELSLSLREGVVVIGRLVDHAGQPLAGVQVHCLVAGHSNGVRRYEADSWVRTRADGAFRTVALEPLSFIRVSAFDSRSSDAWTLDREFRNLGIGRHDVGDLAVAPTQLTLRLSGVSDLSGVHVLASSSTRRDGVPVFATLGPVPFDADGVAVLRGLPVGSLMYSISRHPLLPTAQVLATGEALVDSAVAEIQVEVAPPARVVVAGGPTVTVRSRSGAPVELMVLDGDRVLRAFRDVADGASVALGESMIVGSYRAAVRDGERWGETPFEVLEGAVAGTLRVEVDPAHVGAILDVRVTRRGRAVADAIVSVGAFSLDARAGSGSTWGRTDSLGHLTLRGLPPGVRGVKLRVMAGETGRGAHALLASGEAHVELDPTYDDHEHDDH